MPFKANSNRDAVVVCARHVVKRPSKRSVLVYIYIWVGKFIPPPGLNPGLTQV